jgi:hypothetical protein
MGPIKSFFVNVFSKRLKAWAAAASSAAVIAGFKIVEAKTGVTFDAATQAGVAATVSGIVVHQVDNYAPMIVKELTK